MDDPELILEAVDDMELALSTDRGFRELARSPEREGTSILELYVEYRYLSGRPG